MENLNNQVHKDPHSGNQDSGAQISSIACPKEKIQPRNYKLIWKLFRIDRDTFTFSIQEAKLKKTLCKRLYRFRSLAMNSKWNFNSRTIVKSSLKFVNKLEAIHGLFGKS